MVASNKVGIVYKKVGAFKRGQTIQNTNKKKFLAKFLFYLAMKTIIQNIELHNSTVNVLN